MQKIILFIQIGISALLIASILLQQRGAGSSAILGGGGGASYYTKRGFEKWLYWSTIVLAVLFVAAAVISILLVTKF